MVRETRYLIVRNLPENCTEEIVIDHFQRYGKIQSVKLQTGKDNDSADVSTATVAFNDIKSAAKAHHAKNSIGEVTLRTDYWEGGTPVLASNPGTTVGSATVRGTSYTSSSATPAASRLASSFTWGKGPSEEDVLTTHEKGDAGGSCPAPTASAALDKLSSTAFDLQRGRGRERIKQKKFGQKFEKCGSFGRHGTITSARSLEASRSQSEAAVAAANSVVVASSPSSSLTPATACHTSGSSSSSGSTSVLNPIIITDSKDIAPKDLKESTREVSSRSRPHSIASPSSRHSGLKKSHSHSRSVSRSRSRSRGSSSSRSQSSGTSQSTTPHRSHTSSATRPQSMVGTSRLVNSESRDFKKEDGDVDRRPLGICVSGLPARSSDTSIRDGLYHEYKKHGKVTSVQICGEEGNRCAIVSFKKPEDACKALEASQSKVFFGKSIRVTSHEGVEVEDADKGSDSDGMDEYHSKSTRTLFVGNLEKDTTAADLTEKFKKFGHIIDIDIKRQGATTAFAFVQYSDIASVVAALRAMEGEHIGINKIKLGFGKSMPTCCVWVDCLTEDISSRKLKSAMSRFGEVSYCCVDRKRLKALVHFTSYEDAQYCVSDIKQRPNFLKTKVQVDFASRECQNDFLDQMEKTGQIRANDRPDETGRTHKFRTQRSFDTFPDEGSPTLFTFTRTPTAFASRNNGRSSSGSSSYRRSRQYGETSFPEENHTSSRRTRWPEEFSQSGQFFGSKGSGDDYEAVLREYGHSQRERRERDLSPRPLEDRRVESQSKQSSRDHSIDRYENNRNVDVYNSRDSSPGSEHNSYHSEHRHRASRDDKYSTRDRYDDSKVEEKDSDRHSRLSRTASPFLRNQSRSHSHDSDYDHRGGSRSQSPPTPIQEDSSAHRIYYADDHKRSLNVDGEYSVYPKSKDSEDKGKTISLHSSKLGAEVLKTAGKLKRREHEELVLSDLSKLEKLVRKSDKSSFVQEKSQAFSDKDKKLHFDPSRRGSKGHEQIGSPSSSGSHGDSENGSVSEGDLHHLHEEKHHILQKLQELSEEGVGISEPDSPQTAAKVKSVAVKEALRVSGRIHDDRKGEDLLLKEKKQGAKVRETRRDSRNHELGWEDRSALQDKNMSFSGAISDSDSDSALKRTKTRAESGVDTASKSQSLLRQGGVAVSDEEEADGKSDRSFKLHGSSVVKRLSCDSRLGSKSCSNVTKAAEVSCDSSDLFQGGFSDKDLTVIKPSQSLSKSDSYFPSRDWAAEYGGGEHSPVGCFSPANSDEQSQDSVTSGSLTEKSLKHLQSPSWQHSPLNSLLGQGHSETDYNYYKDFTLPGNISADSLSDDSLGDDGQPPSGEPSLEERIRAIDEMLNMTITNKSSDPSLLMSVLSNKDIANNNDNSVLYSKFRIRKRDGAENGNGGIVADRKPEPSVIMQQVLSKKSILDQDIQRLEQMSEKYDLTGCGPSLIKNDLSTLLRLPDLKVDSCVKPVLSPSLSSSFSSPSPLISSVPATTSSLSVLLSVATAAVAGSAISSAVFSASVLTTSSVSTPVTTCSIHVSSKPSPIDSSSRFVKVKTLEGVEDLLNVHPISSDSLTLKPDSVMSPLPTSSVCVLTCSGNLFSSSSSSSSSPVLNSVIGSPLITDSSSFSSVVPHNFKFVTSTLPPLSSALSPVSSTTSNFLSNLLHHKPNLQQSVSKLPYTSSSLSLPSSSSLLVSPSTSGISAAAPFTQGPDKSQLTPIVGQEAPHLCSPSFTPENSRTSLNSHLPGSCSPRIHSQKSDRDDGIHASSKVDLNISVSNETFSKPGIDRNAGSSISPDIESPVSVQSETSSTSSVPLSSLDIKSNVRADEKSDVIVCTSLRQPGVLTPHGDDADILAGSSVQESGLQHSEQHFGTSVVDRASNKDKFKLWRAADAACLNVISSQPVTVQTVEATNLNVISSQPVTVQTVEATNFKAVSSQPVMSTCIDLVSPDAGLANATSSDVRLKSASIGSTSVLQPSSLSVLQSSSSSVLQSSNSDSGSSGLKLGATSSGSQNTESDAAATLVPRSSNQIPASSKMPGDRNDKKVSGKSSAGNSRISNSLSKPEALFAPDMKTEQAVSKTDVRHQSQKSTSNKSSSDKKSSKSAHKETHDMKSASGREVGKSEKTSELDSKGLAGQEAASKSKEVNKVKDKRDQSKESEKLKQKEKEENKKKDEKKGGDKKMEKRPQVGGKDEKQAEKKPEDRKDKTNEKSKDSGKVNQTKHSKHESKPDSSLQSKDKSKDVGTKVKDKEKSVSKISDVKHGKTPSKSDSKVKSSKNESLVKSDKENTQKSGVKTIENKDEINRSVKVPEVAGKLENKESLTAKSDGRESVVTTKSESRESVLTSKSESKESLTTTPLKKAPEIKAKKEPQKENCKQTPAKQSDKNQKVKQKEKHRTKESKHQNENEEIITQKLKDEKELKDQEEKESKEKDEKLKEEKLKEREVEERKQREKEEKERQKEKEREDRERQFQKEEKERQKAREKEEKERLKKEREERERQKREEREQREREREERERQKEKEREEKLKQKKEEKEERERQKEKEREEKEKQKEKDREEKERQKEKEKEEKERQRDKERLEKEKQKEKEREEKEKQKDKEREENPKEVEKLSEKDNEKKKEKDDTLKIKGSKEKEKTEKMKEKKDHEKKAKKEQVQKEKEEKAKEEKAKKERDEKIRKDKEKKEQEQKKVPPKKPKRNELAALLEHNDMIQMSFTSMYDRVKTQRNREPEPQHKTEPAPKSSFDKFRQNRKKGGSRSHELYSFDTSSDGSGDLSSLSEDSEPEQKPDKSELSPVKETKPKTKKPIKRPHLSSSSSGEEDEVALLRATKPKGKKQEKSFSEIFSSDSDDDNFQPPASTVKSSKQKSKPASKKRKTRDDSSDSMTSREESVKASLSLVTDSLGDLDSSDDEVIKKKKKKTIKSNDADDKTSSTETLAKKKITSDVSVESTPPKTGKTNKEEKTPKKSKPESKKSPKAIEKKLSVSKDEVKFSNEKKKNKIETSKNDNKINSAVKLETTQQKVDDDAKLESKSEPDAIKAKAYLKDKEPDKLKAKNKTKLTSEGKSKAEEKPKNKLESASKAGLNKLPPSSGNKANLSKPVVSSDKKTDIEKVKLVEEKPPKVKSDEKQKSKEVEVKVHSEKVKAERDKKLEGKSTEEEIKQTEKKIAVGTTKSGVDTSVKMEVDGNSTSAKSCPEVMSVELDTKRSKVKSAVSPELEKSSKVDGEMEVEEMSSKSVEGLEKKIKVSGERKKKIEEKDDGLVKKKKKKKFDLSIEEELVNSLITKVYDRDKKKKKMNVLDSESDDTAQSEHSQEPSRLDHHEPSKEEEDMELVVTKEEKPIVSPNMSDKQATEFKPVEQSMEPVTDQNAEAPKKKHKKKKEKIEPEKEVGEKEVKEEEVVEVKLEQQSTDLADVAKPPKKKKKKKDHDDLMDRQKKKAGKPGQTPEKKSEAQKSEDKQSGNASEEKSGSQVVDEFTSFWGHPKPILIPKRLKDSKKTDDDKSNSKEPTDDSKMKGSSEKTDLLTEVKEEPGEGREKQSPSSEDALCDLYLDLDKKPPTPRLESEPELDANSEYVVPISEAETTVITELGSISALDSVSSSKYSPEPEESSLAAPDEITLGSSIEIDDDDFPSLVIDELSENMDKVKRVKEHKACKKPLDRHAGDLKKGGFSFKDAKSVTSEEEDQASLLIDGPAGDQEVLLSDIINQELEYNSKISNEAEQKSVLGSDRSRQFSDINSKEKYPGLISPQKGLSVKDKNAKISAVDSDKRKDAVRAFIDLDRKKDTLKTFGDLDKRKDTLKALSESDKKDTLKTLSELDKKDTLKAFGPLDEETKKRDEELLKTLAVLCDPHLEQPVVIDVMKDISQGDKHKLEAERKEAERKKVEERKKIEEEKRKAEEKKLKAEEEKKKEEEKKRKEEEEKERAEKEKKKLEEEKKRKEEEERKKAEENKIRAEEEKKRAEEEKKKAEEEKKRMEEEAKKKAEEDEKNRREKEEQLLREASDEAARAVESLLEFQCGYEPESVDMEDELPPLFIESVRKHSPPEPVAVPSPQETATVSPPPEPATVSSPPEPVVVPLPQETDKPEVVSIVTSPIPEKVTANLDDQLLSKSLEEIRTFESGETKLDPFLFPTPTSCTQVSTAAVLTSPRRNSAAAIIREPTPEKMISPQRIVGSSQPASAPSHRMQFPQRTISSSPQHSQGQSPQRSLPTPVGLSSPPPVTLHTPPTSVSLHTAPATVPLHTPPTSVSLHPAPMTVPLHAPPTSVSLHAAPATVPLHAPPTSVSLNGAPGTVPLHAPPTSVSLIGAPVTVSLHVPPTSVSLHAASPVISLHSPAPLVPLHAQPPPASVIQAPPAVIPAPLQSTPLQHRPAFFGSKDTKMDRNYLLGSPEVSPHSDMDISLGSQHRRLPAGLIVQPISEPPVRPIAVSPRRKSQEFVSEQHILASRRNTIAAPEEASMTYLDRAFPTYVGPDMILSKEHTQGTSSLPPPVSISLDKMPHDSDSQSSLSLPSHQDNLLLSPKKMSPGFQFKERLPEPPMFHSVTNKSLMQESSLSHFAKGASPDNVFSAYAAKGSSHEQLFYGSKGHPGASAPPDFFKSNKFPDQQTMLHVKSAMNEKPMPAQPIKLAEPLLLPQKNPVPEFVLPHGKAPAHVLEQFPLQPESKNMLVREPLFSPKSQPDNPLNYPDQNIDFLLNSPPRNSVGFSHFPPNTEVNLPLVQKQPDYNHDPLFMSPSDNSTVRPSEREHLPKRAEGFPASFYQEPASASKPHQDTVTISLQHPPPSLADDEKKNTRKRKRNSRKTTNEDRAAALAEQQAIEQSVQANVDSIRKALNANQAKAAAEKAGGGVDKKKSLDAYDFEPDLGPDFGSHPTIPSADLLESEQKTLRSRGDRGRGRAMGTRRGRRGRGAMSSMMDQSDSIHRPEPSLFPPTVSPFSSHAAHSQDHLPAQLHHHYHHPHPQPQQQHFPRPMAQPNSISRPLPQFFSNPPTSLPSDPSLNLPASADWQLKQTPLPHLYQHKAPQQIVQPPAPLKVTSCPGDVMSPESNKQDLDLSYGESELIINLDDQPLSSEGKENQHSLSSDGEGNLTQSPSTPKSQRSTRTRKQPDYKAIASGNSQVPVQPRSSRSGGSPRAAGNGAQSPKNLSPRTRSSENVSSSPVVKLEKLEVGRTTRSRRDAAAKGQMKDIINDGSGRLEDGLIKGSLEEGRSLSKENIYEFVDNEQELLLESSLRSSRTRKSRNSGSQELTAQQTMPDYMPGSPISSSNSSSLFGHEQKHGLEPQPPEVRVVEESAKMSNVDAIIEAVSKGNFGTFEESPGCETVKPGSLTDADQTPVLPTTRSTRRSTEFKKDSDEKVDKFAVAENVRPETREACRKALESKEANRKGSEGKEGSRKGPTVPPLIIKVNEEKHYVIERAKGDAPAESEKPPLAFTVKLSDSGTATIKPAGVANVALPPSSQLPAVPVKPPVTIAPDATKVELPPKKDGNSLGLFSGLPQSEQQANSETDHARSTGPVSQAPVWKPPEVVHEEPVISRPTGALHPKVAAKVHASQEIQNSLSQNQQTSASVSQSAASALQTPTPTVVSGHQPFLSNSTQLPAPKSSPVTPATPQGLKHGWAAGMQQQEPQLQLPTSESPNSSPYLPPYLQQQMSQLSSPMPRESPLLHKPLGSSTLPEVKLPPNAHSQPIHRPDLPGNAHSQPVLRADLPGKVSKPGGLEINSDMAAKLASEVQKHHQNPFSFPPHVPPAHSGQRSFTMPTDQPGHLPSHFTNAALLKAGSDTRPAKSPSIQSQVGAKMVQDGRTQTPPVTSSAMLYAGVVSGPPHSLSPTTASPEGQVIERIQNPLRSEAGQSQSPLGLHVSGSHLQGFIKDDGQDSSLPVHNERTSSQQMVMLQMLEHQRLQQHLIMAEAAARNSAPDSARLNAMRTVQELARNTPIVLESSRKGPMTPSQSLGLSQPLNLTPQSDSRVGQPDPSRLTPKSTPPAPQSPFSLQYFDRSKADSGRLSGSVAGSFMQPSPGGHRDGLPHVYSELSIANLTAHNTYMVSRLPIDPRIYGSGQQPPHLMRDGVLSGSFPQSFPPGSRFPGLEHPDGKKEQSHSDQPAHHMLRSPSPIQRLQADALRQQLTRMPCDLTARESPVGFLQRYPVMWQGALALKNDNSYVQMHFIAGNRRLPNQALPQPMQNGALPPLRISQRMRLEHAQLEGVAKRMQCEEHYCILIAVACGRDQIDINHQTRALNDGFITYLLSKQAAGIVNVPLPGSEQVRFVVHIFPPCEFVDNSVAQQGSVVLMEQLREVPHAVVIIATT